MIVLNFLTLLKSHLCSIWKFTLRTFSGGTDTMPLPYLFRSYSEMPEIEQKALQIAYGRILDVGCGAGGHSLWLQQHDKTVTAMDISAGAVAVCKSRGIEKVVQEAFLTFNRETFDTFLLLMNGIGLARSMKALPKFLEHA